MIQKIRWLAAAVMLFAVVSAVRAEEEEAPPAGVRTVELLPAPTAVDRPFVHVLPPAPLPAGVWSLFAVPQSPPCPVPFMPAGFASYGEGCGVCPCPAGCASCPCPFCPACAGATSAEPTEYVVEMKMFKAHGGEPDVMLCPRVCVAEGQTAHVQVNFVETPREQSGVELAATVVKQGQGVALELGVTESCCHSNGKTAPCRQTSMIHTHCGMTLGKTTKLKLANDADGACTSWAEVTVTQAVDEAPLTKTASAGSCPGKVCEEEGQAPDSWLADALDVVQGLFEMAADTASNVAGVDASTHPAPVLVGEYLQNPPEYCAPATYLKGAACSGCKTAACTQCAAAETVKQTAHVHIGVADGRKTIRIDDGDKHWKGTAASITIHDGCLEMVGYQSESSDGLTSISADRIILKLEKSEVQIEIGD